MQYSYFVLAVGDFTSRLLIGLKGALTGIEYWELHTMASMTLLAILLLCFHPATFSLAVADNDFFPLYQSSVVANVSHH